MTFINFFPYHKSCINIFNFFSVFVFNLYRSYAVSSPNTSIQMKKYDLFWKDLAILMWGMAKMNGYVLRLFVGIWSWFHQEYIIVSLWIPRLIFSSYTGFGEKWPTQMTDACNSEKQSQSAEGPNPLQVIVSKKEAQNVPSNGESM